MIDFIKIHGLAANASKILKNGCLTFPLSNIATTGEVLNRWQVAQCNGLTFKVKGNNVRLEFSPHKFFEGGKTNFRDFHVTDIQDVIAEISETFEFDPEKSGLNFIEIGVNVRTDIDPNKIINCLVAYKNLPFKLLDINGKGRGVICNSQQFDIKIYNKGLQFGLNYYLLRFEVKVKRMKFLEQYGIKSLTLAGLANIDNYPKFKMLLLEVVNGILMYNPEITPDKFKNQKERELFIEGRYAQYWQNLERTKRHRLMKRFTEMSGSDNIKNKLYRLILEKCNELTTCNKNTVNEKMQRNNRFQETNKRKELQRNNLPIKCYSVAYCIVTGLQQHNQRPGTKYLSPKSIQWYYENEPETYKKTLECMLTKKWQEKHRGEPIETRFAEIAHQIRNKDRNPKNNPRNNTKKSFRNIERKGLKLFPMAELVAPGKLKLISSFNDEKHRALKTG